MSKIQLTLAVDSFDELADVARRLSGTSATVHVNSGQAAEVQQAVTQAYRQTLARISPADRPDAGIDVTNLSSAGKKYLSCGVETDGDKPLFGQQPASSPVAAPLPPADAPCSAGAALPSTAPAAPLASSIAPPAPPAPAQTPAAPADVPAAPAAPSSHVAGVELDASGFPWDARIHSGSKERNKDGTWRQRRNLADGVRESVEAELKGLLAVNATAGPPLTAPAPPVAPPAPPAPPAPLGTNPLGALLVELGPHFAAGKLTPAAADAVAQKHGLQNLSQAMLTPNLVPAIRDDLLAMVA